MSCVDDHGPIEQDNRWSNHPTAWCVFYGFHPHDAPITTPLFVSAYGATIEICRYRCCVIASNCAQINPILTDIPFHAHLKTNSSLIINFSFRQSFDEIFRRLQLTPVWFVPFRSFKLFTRPKLDSMFAKTVVTASRSLTTISLNAFVSPGAKSLFDWVTSVSNSIDGCLLISTYQKLLYV